MAERERYIAAFKTWHDLHPEVKPAFSEAAVGAGWDAMSGRSQKTALGIIEENVSAEQKARVRG